MNTNLTASELQRFEELKGKGFINLKKDEKLEYSNLLAKAEATPETTAPQKENKTDEPSGDDAVIKITKGELKKIVAEMTKEQINLQSEKDGLEKQVFGNKWLEWKPETKKNKTGTFRLYQEDSDEEMGLIVDWQFHKNIFDEETRKVDKPIYKITLLYPDDSTKQVEISLEDFAKIEDREKVEILEIDKKKVFKDFGEVYVTEQDKDGTYLYSNPKGDQLMTARKTAMTVPLRVFKDSGTCTCKRQSGQVFKVAIDRINA